MLSLEEAREALGAEGRRLSDDQVRQRAEEANAVARLVLEVVEGERRLAARGLRRLHAA